MVSDLPESPQLLITLLYFRIAAGKIAGQKHYIAKWPVSKGLYSGMYSTSTYIVIQEQDLIIILEANECQRFNWL